MRLIDADELKIKFEDAMFNDNMINPLMRYTDILELLDEQSTAYDIDKVVEELGKLPSGYNCIASEFQRGANYGAAFIKKKAIEIVKRGGKE